MSLENYNMFEKAMKELELTEEETNELVSNLLILNTHFEGIDVLREILSSLIMGAKSTSDVQAQIEIAKDLKSLRNMIEEEVEAVYLTEQKFAQTEKLPLEIKTLGVEYSKALQLRMRNLYSETYSVTDKEGTPIF